MTKEEKIIATAFTGTMFIDGSEMGLLYEYMEKKVGHGVIDLMLADKGFWEELHKACKQGFIDMISKESPSIPSNLDEVAGEYAYKYTENDNGNGGEDWEDDIRITFIAGAEWMAKQLPLPEDSVAFQKGVQEGRRLEREDVLTIADIEMLHALLYAVKNNKHGAFTFTRLTDEQYEEVLRRFNNAKEK
jgi:hypothetical protein